MKSTENTHQYKLILKKKYDKFLLKWKESMKYKENVEFW